MGNRIVLLIAAQDGDGDVAILHEPAPVQAAAERAQAATGSAYDLGSFGFGPVSRRLAEKAQGLAHLRFSFVDRP